MKKLIIAIFLLILCCQQYSFADEVKNEMYYKRQIQNQRYLYNNTGFFNAITKKDSKTVELFLKAGFNPNTTCGGTPIIMHALFVNDMKSFELLLKAGADPETSVPALWVSAKPQNLLSFAIKRKSSEAVKILIENKVDVNKVFNGRTPLNYTISSKQTKITEMLLRAGAKPDEKTMELVNKSKDEYLKSLFE